MDLMIKRIKFSEFGIFGILYDKNAARVCVTLEHAYPSDSPLLWAPKVPPGKYICLRGEHQLLRQNNPFETFEITNVPGHTAILFHVGNTNDDTAGCVLLGSGYNNLEFPRSIINSKLAFKKFMDLQSGVDRFNLEVE